MSEKMIAVTPVEGQTLIEQYEAIRKGCSVNMADRNSVQHVANKNNFYALVVFIADGKYPWLLENYGNLIKTIDRDDIEPVYL